jgi:hypothetical protein
MDASRSITSAALAALAAFAALAASSALTYATLHNSAWSAVFRRDALSSRMGM